MIRIQVEGDTQQVQTFLNDLRLRSHIELCQQETHNKETDQQTELCVTCYIKCQPNQRIQIVEMVTEGGVQVDIPMLDMIEVEIEKGVKLFVGKVFDVFA